MSTFDHIKEPPFIFQSDIDMLKAYFIVADILVEKFKTRDYGGQHEAFIHQYNALWYEIRKLIDKKEMELKASGEQK